MVDERIINTVQKSDALSIERPLITGKCQTDKSNETPCCKDDNLLEASQEATQHQHQQQQQHQQLQLQEVRLSDLLGDYGYYQLFLTLIAFVRYVCLALMTNTGPLIAPSLTFWCQLPQQPSLASDPSNDLAGSKITIESLLDYNRSSHLAADYLLKNKCALKLTDGSVFKCNQWTYDQNRSGITLTDTFDLVCDREWLRSAFQSFISVGISIATVVWGTASDEQGRRLTMNVSILISFVAGLASYWAPSYWIYTLTRSICTMCDLAIAGSLYTIIVETLGNKYRGIVCLIVTTGWSIGVMVMPWVTGYFLDFRKVMLFTVVCHVATLPWLLLVGESPRWLFVNGRIKEVQLEIHRICRRWNFKSKRQMAVIDDNFEILKAKYKSRQVDNQEDTKTDGKYQKIFRTFFGGFAKIDQIFKSKKLVITTLVFIWIIFNSELLYMIFIFVNSDNDENVKLNYAVGGIMEMLATLISIVMISALSRRLSLSSILTIVSVSMVGLAFAHDTPDIFVYFLNFSKLAGSVLTSLVFVIITELFPTNLRQTGTGISSAIGSGGAIIAPFIHNELTALIGFKNVMLVLCFLPLSAAILVPFFLRETKGVELADDVDEITS